jgi:hypothetical protein
MRNRILIVAGGVFLVLAGYVVGTKSSPVALADEPYVHPHTDGTVPKSYGRLVTAIADRIGTGLVFEDPSGVIRFVSVTGMKEGELARYDTKPVRGGIPKSYGHLVTAVVGEGGTALVFEDEAGVIRFVTITGVEEGKLTRD